MDPGNFATNIQAGSQFGYSLLWVVWMANMIAMLFQALSAKLGIVTGRNLAEMCREQFSRPIVYAMWAVSEVAAMATNLAEFLGVAIALSLLFELPPISGMLIMATTTYGILLFGKNGSRPMEIIIGTFVGVIGLCYLAEMFIAPVSWGLAGFHSVVPTLPNAEALTPRSVALSVAGLINMAMVIMASSAFLAGHSDVAEIETAYHTLTPLLGAGAAAVFLVSLISSGVSSR